MIPRQALLATVFMTVLLATRLCSKIGPRSSWKIPIAPREPKLLKDLLAGKDLRQIIERAREAGELDARVRALLPEAMAAHVTGAVLHDCTVVVLVDSAAWASRLRFHAPELVERLAPRYDGVVTRVRVKVRPA
jgi:hypothetical protein